jgi:hypothetical protein
LGILLARIEQEQLAKRAKILAQQQAKADQISTRDLSDYLGFDKTNIPPELEEDFDLF